MSRAGSCGRWPVADTFDPDCARCPRIARHLAGVRCDYPGYHAAPVAAFGTHAARLWVIGLAPGMHGANATGRPFTGDYAGLVLYPALHQAGYASQPEATGLDDGLELRDCYITNAVKCLPPANRPLGSEVVQCNQFLAAELRLRPPGSVLLALGRVAHGAVLRALGLRGADYPFAHGAQHRLGEGWLVDSYHCSRYNIQTRRLSTGMFRQVVEDARRLTTCSKAIATS